MEALLAAYRLGARVAWRRASAVGRDAGFDSETLALLARLRIPLSRTDIDGTVTVVSDGRR